MGCKQKCDKPSEGLLTLHQPMGMVRSGNNSLFTSFPARKMSWQLPFWLQLFSQEFFRNFFWLCFFLTFLKRVEENPLRNWQIRFLTQGPCDRKKIKHYSSL